MAHDSLVAKADVWEEGIVTLLDYRACFDLAEIPLPENRSQIMQRLGAEGLVARNSAGKWDVTNLGAILFAKRLDDFRHLRRKAVRAIAYEATAESRRCANKSVARATLPGSKDSSGL